MIVLLTGRSLLCAGLAGKLGQAEWPVVSVPLTSSIKQLAATLRKVEPQILIIDASDMRGAGFLFLDGLRHEAGLTACPVLIVAGGSMADAERFCAAAAARGMHVELNAVGFDELVAEVEALIGPAPVDLVPVAD